MDIDMVASILTVIIVNTYSILFQYIQKHTTIHANLYPLAKNQCAESNLYWYVFWYVLISIGMYFACIWFVLYVDQALVFALRIHIGMY